MMKVLYVIGSMELGGAEQHLLRVASALRLQGYAPEVFALTTGGPLTQAFIDSGIPVHGSRLPQWLAHLLRHERAVAWAGLLCSAAALWLLYWRRRPQVVHFFLPAAYIVGGVVALCGPRTHRVMSRRSLNLYQDQHRLFRRIEHWLHRRMDRVCGNSRAVVNDLIGEGVAEEQIRLIYNGIPLTRFEHAKTRSLMRGDLDVAQSALMIVMVANLIPYKGHDDLIDALSYVANRLPTGWICLCVGRDDGIGPALRQKAMDNGLSDHIRFLGSRQDVPDILSAADIGVLSSHEEGFSNAVLEGMAAGLPMVVTDVGGNGEAVLHGATGLVVPSRQPQELGRALLKLARDPGLRSTMGREARQRVQETFSMSSCIAQYTDMYKQVLNSRSRHREGKSEPNR